MHYITRCQTFTCKVRCISTSRILLVSTSCHLHPSPVCHSFFVREIEKRKVLLCKHCCTEPQVVRKTVSQLTFQERDVGKGPLVLHTTEDLPSPQQNIIHPYTLRNSLVDMTANNNMLHIENNSKL
jgi:hypothetical protein